MKTKYLIPALLLLMLAGCYKEQTPVEEGSVPRKGTFNFSSSTGEVTKVLLNSDNTLFWAAGDKIAVYDYKGDALVQSDVANLTGGEGTAVGTFTPATHTSNTAWFITEDDSEQEYNFYAFYPGASATPSSKMVSVSVATEQKQSQGIGQYIISYAAANTKKSVLAGDSAPNFAFAPKSALLKLTLRNSADIPVKITSIQISAASVNIAGDASLNLGTGVLSAGSGKVITYIPSSPIEIAAGAVASAPVYVSMLPCAPGSLTVTLNQDGFKYNSPSITLATIESGHVYSKDATISSVSRELAISNDNTTNLADASAMDSDPTLYYGTSNCVVMDANDVHGVIAIGLYKSDDGYSRSNSSAGKNAAVKKAKVIWAEKGLYEDPNFCIASGTKGMLTVTKSAGVTGNALIGIYDESDGLLWSYHVWCPFDKSTLSVTSEGDASAKFVAFKLALGQVYGSDCDTYMYYQWGRKDPLGRAESNFTPGLLTTMYGDNKPGTETTQKIVASDTPGSSTNNLSYARNNPWVFIMQAGETLKDWYSRTDAARSTTTQNDNLWKSNIATIYDPCPAGYRVAPKVLWAGDKTKQPGPLFDSAGLWYVLGGDRGRANAGVGIVTSYGGYWSSEAVGESSTASYCLGFNSGTYVGRAGDGDRASGVGVRCVKEDDSSIKREIAISNSNSGENLANSAALDAAYADDETDASSLYYGAANCVVMGASDTRALIDIRLKKSTDGYSRSGADPSPKVTAVKKAKVIWAEADLYRDSNFGIAAGTVSQLVIQKSAGTTGNALVGIYDESDQLLWSYHIWCPMDRSVVSATSEDASPVTYQAYKLALGQILGADCDTYMYYQWGRKDPLGRAKSSFTDDGSRAATYGVAFSNKGHSSTGETVHNLGYARKNPTVFITNGNTTPYDWYNPTDKTNQNDNLWKSDIATIFDPCPQGYHVAPKKLWAGNAAKVAGPLFESAGLWYVLGGNRSRFGVVDNVASCGSYWSSEVVSSSEYAYFLEFYSSTSVYRWSSFSRANGYGVRCVK